MILAGDEGYKQCAVVASQPGIGRTPRGELILKYEEQKIPIRVYFILRGWG